ncbi:MAG: RNA polymerase sigma factor [Candidatus Obscuribacterales bacterium]|nr:RNA polymerase sigma factor [Candidatus Obscuribacterales bacterium]MBY0552842.1 RNA polymerase sigma factor [Candidatus Obscuribacterales bacterium]
MCARGERNESSIARRYFKNREDCEDLAQDVIEKLLKRPVKCKSLRGWVSTVARRTMIDTLRTRNVQPPFESGLELDDIAGEVYLISDRLDFERALTCLSRERKDAVILWAQGFTYAEIARQTGSCVGSIKSGVHFAKRQLREALTTS